MSSLAAAVAINANRWELASRLAGPSPMPETALQLVFKGAIKGLEQVAKTPFQTEVKDRVWVVVSSGRVDNLKTAMIQAIYDYTLCNFNDQDIELMLSEHKSQGAVKNELYCSRLCMAHFLNKNCVINSVTDKVKVIADEWVPEIVDALNKEGIPLKLGEEKP